MAVPGEGAPGSVPSGQDRVRHVMGYSWRSGTPVMRVRPVHETNPDTEPEALPLVGEVCLTPLGKRRCVGHRDPDSGVRVACPERASLPLTSGDGQCARCKDEEGVHPCIRCDGVRCPVLPPAAERYCLRQHHLYLADFGEGAGSPAPVKVGTASEGRKLERLLEQGALAATYVAAAPGPVIKRLEKQVAALGLTERMTRRRKGATVFATPDVAAARRRILEAYQTVLRELRSDEAAALHHPEVVPLPEPPVYAGTAPLRPAEVRAGATISGAVLGVRGPFVLLETLGAPVILDVAALRGHLVDLAPAAPAAPPAAQMRLL